jgi:RNA polymerase sigma-70 factor (ECF subfamily)
MRQTGGFVKAAVGERQVDKEATPEPGRSEGATVPATPDRPNIRPDFALLFREHAEFVRRVILRMAGPGLEVDDLVQQTFAAAIEGWASFCRRSTERGWLHGIALRTVGTARRRARIRRMFQLRALGSEPFFVPTPALEARDAMALVYSLLERLSERKRTVFILSEIEGMSAMEIAQLVGVTVGTVRVRLHHARREFDGLLARFGAAGAPRGKTHGD